MDNKNSKFLNLNGSLKEKRLNGHLNAEFNGVTTISSPRVYQLSSIPGSEHFPPPLSPEQAEKLHDIHGRNVIATGKKLAWYRVLYNALVHPFNILLCILAAASGGTEDFDTMGIMLFMVLLSTGLRFYQEWKSEVAAQGLRSLVCNKVTVLRYDSSSKLVEQEIDTEDVVPGDWVNVTPGDLIPADIRIITSKDLFVSQASLTGEAIPVEKFVDKLHGRSGENSLNSSISDCSVTLSTDKLQESARSSTRIKNKAVRFAKDLFGMRVDLDSDYTKHGRKANLDRPDLCYMGTSVVSGTATAIVRCTGSKTYFGSMAVELAKRRPQNAFQLGVRRISWIFFITMTLMVPPVLMLQGFLRKDWTEAFLFALGVAVGLTPEMLPMIVNTTLARGAYRMAQKRCIVKRLDAIVNMGGMDVLCTDKTGTLTENKVVMIRHIDFFGKTSILPLQLAYLNSYFQTGLKNLLDVAVVDFFREASTVITDPKNAGVKRFRSFNEHSLADEEYDNSIASAYTKVDEIPFDFVRRRMSVVLQDNRDRAKFVLVSKGAVDEMLSICTHTYCRDQVNNADESSAVRIDTDDIHVTTGKASKTVMSGIHNFNIPNESNIVALTPNLLSRLIKINEILNKDGLRVVAVAFKKLDDIYMSDRGPNAFGVADEANLIFAGFIAFLDPPKASTKPAIKELLLHGVNVKVLTGDSPVVCRNVCEQIELPVSAVVTTNDLEGASDEKISELAESGTIFAKLTPLQKAQVIRGLKRKNHIVGFLGDGINDAPALSEADVGISVDTGTDIAKESADIILLEKDLQVVSEGVVGGRETYGNTLKYIVMAISSNFGNVFSMLVASSWLPYLPMLPIHIVAQNLLYDISQIAIPWDNMDPEFLMVPHRWSMKSVLRFMACMGPWSSIFDITTFIFMYYYFDIQSSEDPQKVLLFQTTWFTEGLLTQTLIVHMIRTPKIPFIQSRASLPVCIMTVVIMTIGLVVPYIPGVGTWLNMVHLKGMVYPYVVSAILAYCIIAQLAKMIYIKIFKEWF